MGRCSRVVMSPYSRFLRFIGLAADGGWLDWANSSLGIVYYISHIMYPILKAAGAGPMPEIWFIATAITALLSFWLVFCLFWYVQDRSIGFILTYGVNFALVPVMFRIMQKEYDGSAAKYN